MPRPSTRDEILRVAAEQFTRVGFKGTSLQEIAAGVGCSKAALLYHFASKEEILRALVRPAAEALGELLGRLAPLPDDAVQAAAVDGFVELVLRFRREVSLLDDLSPRLLSEPAFADVRPLTDPLVAAFAGRSAEPARTIAAGVLLSGIASAVMDDQRDAAVLRPALIEVARRGLLLDRD